MPVSPLFFFSRPFFFYSPLHSWITPSATVFLPQLNQCFFPPLPTIPQPVFRLFLIMKFFFAWFFDTYSWNTFLHLTVCDVVKVLSSTASLYFHYISAYNKFFSGICFHESSLTSRLLCGAKGTPESFLVVPQVSSRSSSLFFFQYPFPLSVFILLSPRLLTLFPTTNLTQPDKTACQTVLPPCLPPSQDPFFFSQQVFRMITDTFSLLRGKNLSFSPILTSLFFPPLVQKGIVFFSNITKLCPSLNFPLLLGYV